MIDWNVIVTVRRGFASALSGLRPYGTVERTGLFNVMVMRVPDVRRFLDQLAHASSRLLACVSHVIPITHKLRFDSAEALERDASVVILGWALELGGKRIHIRARRRGLEHDLHPTALSHRLGDLLMAELARLGTPARLVTDDPDVAISIETIHDTAALAMWTREDLDRYPLLRASIERPPRSRAPLALPAAPSRALLAAARRTPDRTATAGDLDTLLGELDPLTVERLLATRATVDEVAEAIGAIEDEDDFGEIHHGPSSPREAEVRAILEELVFEDVEERESGVVRA